MSPTARDAYLEALQMTPSNNYLIGYSAQIHPFYFEAP